MDPREALSALRMDKEQQKAPDGHRWLWLPVVLVLVIVLAAGGVVRWSTAAKAVPVRTTPVLARVAPAGAIEGGIALNASGFVVAREQATVAAQITGMVTAVYVREGDIVAAGEILARLDDGAAKATRDVLAGQLVADRALIGQYQTELDRNRRSRERAEQLLRSNAISESALDAARAAEAIAQAQLAHARGQVTVDERNLALQDTLLSYTVIRAPFAGVVTECYAHRGEMISPQAVGGFTQTGICQIVDMRSLEIEVDVNETYIQRVRLGQKVEAVINAYPTWTIPAHVVSVLPTADARKATVKVRIGFDRPDPRILPQMGGAVRFLSDETAPPPGGTGQRDHGPHWGALSVSGRTGVGSDAPDGNEVTEP